MARPLLVYHDTLEPVPLTVDEASLARLPAPRPESGGPTLDAPHKDPQDLAAQRWGVIYPSGQERLVTALDALVTHRAQQQGHEVVRWAVPRDVEVHEWLRSYHDMPMAERPRYVLILGDLDEVPLDLQLTLAIATRAYVGRLAFDELVSYAAYARKVVASETDEPAAPGLGIVGPNDGSDAMRVAKKALLSPLRRAMTSHEPWDHLEPPDDPTQPLGPTAAQPCQLLLTISHGAGQPKAGWPSAETQRALQGSLHLWPTRLRAPRTLRGTDVALGAVLPRGIWVMHACFAGGTPDRSSYLPWARKAGLDRATLQASLPVDGRPFVSALPKALLANREGPLAVLTHADLAWSYGYDDPINQSRALHTRWEEALAMILGGTRVGVAAAYLREQAPLADQELRALERSATKSPADQEVRANLHLTLEDLRAYLILGDPAAQLPVAQPG